MEGNEAQTSDSQRDHFSNELSLFMEMGHLPSHHPCLRVTTGKDSLFLTVLRVPVKMMGVVNAHLSAQ